MPAPSQLNAGFIIHFCRIFATTPSSSIFVPSLGQLFFFPFVPFGGILAAAIYPIYILQARACRSVLCQAQPVCILSAQRSYSKIPAICSQKHKKGTFICIYGKKVVPLYDFLGLTDANET